MPPYRPRRHTPHGAAVLAVLVRKKKRFWSVEDVADEAEMLYGTAGSILRRFLGDGLVGRTDANDSKKYLYMLTERGRAEATRILQYMPDPVAALTGWLIQDRPTR